MIQISEETFQRLMADQKELHQRASNAAAIPARDGRSWIQTFSGRQVWPLNPRPEDVCVEDIAHALSMICRYGGHVKTFYSVAQHSVLVSLTVPVEDARWGLLHDASEAYLGDVVRPLKPFMGTYKQVERRMTDLIASVFGLDPMEPPSVKDADWVLLATERRDLVANALPAWHPASQVKPLDDTIYPLPPEKAEELFLTRFDTLFPGVRS